MLAVVLIVSRLVVSHMTHPIAFCKKEKPQRERCSTQISRRNVGAEDPQTDFPQVTFKLLESSKIWEESGFPDVDLLVRNDRDDGIRLDFWNEEKKKEAPDLETRIPHTCNSKSVQPVWSVKMSSNHQINPPSERHSSRNIETRQMLHKPDGQRDRAPNGIHLVQIQRVKEVWMNVCCPHWAPFCLLLCVLVYDTCQRWQRQRSTVCVWPPFSEFYFQRSPKGEFEENFCSCNPDMQMKCWRAGQHAPAQNTIAPTYTSLQEISFLPCVTQDVRFVTQHVLVYYEWDPLSLRTTLSLLKIYPW